ncbi:MAG: glycoside hydrolase family 78 protein [Thermoflexibacter sp.]|nr:glycoside hydrolase family 78 protein [Thermoflexibacter sp.]
MKKIMKHLIIRALWMLIITTSTIFAQSQKGISLTNLLCENLVNPIGLDVKQPRFTWTLVSSQRNVMQTAYEIKVMKGKNTVWSSGKVNSDQSVLVEYQGAPLESNQKYLWQVRVWDNQGNTSAWTTPAFWHTAFFNQSDWKAKWIKAGFEEDTTNRPSPYFRRNFNLKKPIQSAMAYITAQGLYEAFLNGKRVGDYYLTPFWTAYQKRLQYQVYEVTNLLKQGDNSVGAMLGSGWFRGLIGFQNNKNFYGKEVALLFQLEITYSDGSKETIISDENWKSNTGSILYSEIYNGETIDARKEEIGWNTSTYNDTQWAGVRIADYKGELLANYNEGIRKHETFKPIKIFKTPKGEQVIDFGQNLVGWVQVKVKGKAGDKVTLYHAEVLDKAGNFYTENLRPAKQKNEYILRGSGEESFEPHFTFQGFRYIKVEGFPTEITNDNFTAVALYSDMKKMGEFVSSHPLINQLQHNIQWGQNGNFLDVPTDCPQRDERLGWTGDAQAFARTATFNRQVHNFFAKWLKDVAIDQSEAEGRVPFVVPNVLGKNASASAGWADVATIIPWDMYLAYGDRRILIDQYESMKSWVGFMEKNSTNYLWNKGFHFGDWLFYRPNDDNDGRAAVTDKYLIAQCFFAHSTNLLIKTAKVLGKNEDVNKYTDLLKNIKEAFMKEYVTPTGRLVSSTQTAYVLSLNFDMFPENLRQQAADRLAENVRSYNTHLTTGFLGTPYLCHVLTRFGYLDLAYSLLLQENYPSWLYPVKMGATTIWERWDGIKPDGSFQNAGMNSFNHYAYGAIGDWVYRVVTGIDTEESGVGYKKIVIKPHFSKQMNFNMAKSELQTYYGKIVSEWKIEGNKKQVNVEIPTNTTAKIFLPASSSDIIKETGQALSSSKGITIKGKEGDWVVIEVGSGKYNFDWE